MERDPAPDPHALPRRHEAPAAQPLTEIILKPAARPSRPPAPPPDPPRPAVELTIDGAAVSVPAGSTILDACRAQGIDTPTLCYLENLTPVNVCRVCVVEVKGSRVLVPACSRKVEAGMEVSTDSDRVRHSRKMVLEFLGSSVDLSTAPAAAGYIERYGADTARYGDAAPPAQAGERDAHEPGPPPRPDWRRGAAGPDRRPAGEGRQRPLRPRLLEVHPLLQVRRGLRRGCPEHVRDRRRRSRLRRPHLDRGGGAAARFGLRLLRQLHRRLPDRGADVQVRVRHARRRDLGRERPDGDRDDLPVLRRRLRARTSTSRTTRSSRSIRRSTRR